MTTRQVAITGANRGIGRSVAEHFLKDGWRVWALVRDPGSVEPLRALGDVHAVAFDAASADSVLAAARRLTTEAGHLTALVNNAGIALSSPLARTSTEDFLRIQAVNVTAPFLLCRELIPAMVKSGAGRVVNIASTAAHKGFKYTSAYCASKHALLGLTRALAVELASRGVTVNAVCPGWTDTDMFQATVDNVSRVTGRSAADARTTLEQLNPLGRAVKPDEVAAVVHFLCASPAAVAITGAAYVIDGGETV
jgi:NAD(P)-dependent dehydrogenase (short-subunit alcohol dehydrogenase family)